MADAFRIYSGNSKDCLALVETAIPNVSKKTLKAVAEMYNIEQKYAPAGMTEQQILEAAVATVQGKMRRDIAAKKWGEYKNLIAVKNVESYIEQYFSNDPHLGMKARQMGIASNIKESKFSAKARQNALRNVYGAGLEHDLVAAGALDPLRGGKNVDFDRAVSTELERIGDPTRMPDTGDPLAKKAAEIIHRWGEKARLDANDAGASIGKLVGYIVRQSHDMFRVRKAGLAAWKDGIRGSLDWERIERGLGYEIKDKEKFLDDTYQDIASGTHLKSVAMPSKAAPWSVAGSLGHERVLHFLPGKWFDYNLQFGSRGLLEAVVAGLEKSANTTGLMEVFGPSAILNMEKIYDKLKHNHPGKITSNNEAMFNARMRSLSGELRIPGNDPVSQFLMGFRAFQSVVKLGGAIVSAGITDPFIMATRFRRLGMSPFKGYGTSIAGDFTRASSADQLAISKAMGVAVEGMLTDLHHRYDSEDTLPGLMSDILRRYFKWNLLTPHTDRIRNMAAQTMSTWTAGHRATSFNDLPAGLKRTFEVFGIDEVDWDTLRAHAITDIQGQSFMNQMAIEGISDADIRARYGADLSDAKVRQTRKALQAKYQSFLIDELDSAVIRPDQETAVWQNWGKNSDNPFTQLIKTLMQFKGFPIAFLQRVVGEEIYGTGAGSFWKAMRHGDVWLGMTWLMAQSTALGYAVMVVKDAMTGKDVPDFTKPGVWKEAALRGGGLGFYGDVLFGEMRKSWGRGAVSALSGPGINTAEDMLDLTARFLEGDLSAAHTVKTIYRNAVPNLIYLKLVLDYAIQYSAMEAFDPGSVRKMERTYEQLHDRQYRFSPSEWVQ